MTKLLALKLGLRKLAPSRFSYSKTNNYYSQTLENLQSGQKVLVKAIGDGKVIGALWDESLERFEHDTAVKVSDLALWNLRTYRFYGGSRYEYDGVFDFWKAELSFLAWRNYILGYISQTYFNAVFRFRSDRMEVLRSFVEADIEAAKNSNGLLYNSPDKGIVQLQLEFFGNRIYGHPAYEEISARFRLIVDSLAASGDLERVNLHTYRLKSKALVTLADFELDERRIEDAAKQNKRLFWITVAIAFATAIQAVSAYFSMST